MRFEFVKKKIELFHLNELTRGPTTIVLFLVQREVKYAQPPRTPGLSRISKGTAGAGGKRESSRREREREDDWEKNNCRWPLAVGHRSRVCGGRSLSKIRSHAFSAAPLRREQPSNCYFRQYTQYVIVEHLNHYQFVSFPLRKYILPCFLQF